MEYPPEEGYYEDEYGAYGEEEGGEGGGAGGAGGAAAEEAAPPDPRASLTRVVVNGAALLKLVKHATRAYPELCAGCLLGVDDGAGGLEVSDCFAFPAARSGAGGGADEDEYGADRGAGGAAPEEDVTDFTNEMMRLLKEVNADDNCVGWYRSVNMGDWCTGDLIEQQFERQEELDLGTGLAKSALIIYDPYQSGMGNLAVKALRLKDAFMDIMRTRANNDARAIAASQAAVSHVRMGDIFYEIPVEIYNPPMITRFLGTLQATPGVADDVDVDFDRLALATDPYLGQNITFAVETMDSLQGVQENAAYYQRLVARQKQQQTKFVAQRKAENAERVAKGLEPLPLRDPSHPAFRPIRDPSRFDALYRRKQIDVYCDQLNTWVAQNVEKLYLVGAAVQTKTAGV